ncbi:MAG TPA: hypothetical protein PLD23_15560 [Armatimonadota bacterium]|nr:hypothetical protein [Armatimonadota bacterium]
MKDQDGLRILWVVFGITAAAVFGAIVLAGVLLGWVTVGLSLLGLVCAGVVFSVVLAWPLAHGVIWIYYAVRPDDRAPRADYSLDQSREAGEDHRRGSSS